MTIVDTYQRIGIVPSPAQLALAKAILGEVLNSDEQLILEECTGRSRLNLLPGLGFQEVTAIIGRKGGKTERIAAPILVHRACTDEDEPGTYLLCAPSKSDQASIGWQAVTAQLRRGFPNLIADIRDSDGRIQLHNGNCIRIQNANFRSLRGPKYKVCVVDEACFFTSDDPELGFANPLGYVLDSVAGGMVATTNPLLLLLSTPWIRDGICWQHYRDREANPDRLVFCAPTLVMNPHANRALMERHRKDRGASFYAREYEAQFGDEVATFLEPGDVDLAIAPQPFFPLRPNSRYVMGLDPGRRRDHFGAAICHREGEAVVCDWCQEWKPGFLTGLKYAEILPTIFRKAREYHVRVIASDQVDFGGIEASVPRVNGVPEFELERVMTGGQAGAEMCDVSRALFAQHNLILPNQPGLGDEFKRLGDYGSQGGGRDIRAKRGADDRSRAIMLAVYQAYKQPASRAGLPTCGVHVVNCHPLMGEPTRIPEKDWPTFGMPTAEQMNPFNDAGFRPRRPTGPSFGPRWRPR